MDNKKLLSANRKMELESELIINQNLYDMNVIDYKTYQSFVNYVLSKLSKLQMN